MPISSPASNVELSSNFSQTRFDALIPTDLLRDEVQQRQETGYDVDEIIQRANATDPSDRQAILALVDEMAEAHRRPGWTYVEPDDLETIRASLTDLPASLPINTETLRDQVHAAWLGRIAGCNLGKPVENGTHWTPAHLRAYLELADAYPLRDYVPALQPMPDGFQLCDNWPETTLGNVSGSARDDDIDYPILALHLLEVHGTNFGPEQVGDAWTRLLPIQQVYTAERAAYLNLVNGLTGPAIARERNPYREWIGAQIRGDVFGYVNPGDPWTAAQLAFQDASLSHTGNGIYGEMWSAALVSAAFAVSTAREAIELSLTVVPPQSRLAEAITHVLHLRDDGLSWDDALEVIRQTYGHYAWVHTINNAAAVAAALLWAEGDFTSAVGKVVMSGWDTDSNGATVGSVAGILTGTANLPAHFIEPLEDRVRSALFGFGTSQISDLADRTYRLIPARSMLPTEKSIWMKRG